MNNLSFVLSRKITDFSYIKLNLPKDKLNIRKALLLDKHFSFAYLLATFLYNKSENYFPNLKGCLCNQTAASRSKM